MEDLSWCVGEMTAGVRRMQQKRRQFAILVKHNISDTVLYYILAIYLKWRGNV
jgi:hypothetical protein